MRVRLGLALAALVAVALALAAVPQALPNPTPTQATGPAPTSPTTAALAAGPPSLLDLADPAPPCHTPPQRLALTGETPHPPIRVNGNAPHQGFTTKAEAGPAAATVYRPGSGVIAGDGTQDDPYLIAGWTAPRIVVENTTAHVRVQQNTIRLQGPQSQKTNNPVPQELLDALIEVRNATNVTIAHNTVDRRYRNYQVGGFSHVRPSIAVRQSHHVTLAQNRIQRATPSHINTQADPLPLLVTRSRHVCLQANDVDTTPPADAGALRIRHSSHVQVRHHDLHPLRTTVTDSPHVTLADNTLGGTTLQSSPHATLRDNAIPAMGNLTTLEAATTDERRKRDLRRRDPALIIEGDDPRDWDHTIPPTNTVRGQPLRYLSGTHRERVGPPAGQVVLHNTTGATVRGVNLTTPLFAAFTTGTTVRNTSLHDITTGPKWETSLWIQDANGFTVENSTVRDALTWVRSARDVGVLNTTFVHSGLRIHRSQGLRLHDLQLVHPVSPIVAIRSTHHVNVTQTRFHSSGTGISITQDLYGPIPENVTLRNNTFDGLNVASWAANGDVRNLTIVDNVFRDIRSVAASQFPMEVHGNNIWEGALHHLNDDDRPDTAPSDARWNWWGCPEGPSSDDCAGAGGPIVVDPWLTEPNPEAGVD